MAFECVKDEKKSEIWQLFLLNKTEKLAKCNKCPLTLKITGGRTSNMWQHVKIHHSAAYQSVSQPARVKHVARRKEEMVSKLVSKIKKKSLNYVRQGMRSTTTVKSESSTPKPGFISNPKSANIDKDNKLDDLAGFETVKRSSNVWQYFLFNKKEESVKCTLCSQQYLDKNGTTQLHNHLKSKHLTEFQSLIKNEPQKKTLTKGMPDFDSFVKILSEASKPIKQEGEITSKLQSTSYQLRKIDDNKASYNCEFCSVEFAMKYQLYEHMALSHKDKKQYKCEKCNAKFTQQKLLDQHFNFMHKPTIEWKCEKCKTNFKSNANLKIHIAAVHDEKKPFKCGMCTSKFSSKFHLNRHLVLIHQSKKTFKCKICHLVYGEVSDLKKHLSSAHKEIKPTKNQHCEPSNKSKSEKLNHETESSVTLDHNSEVSSQTSSGQLKEYFGMVHEGNKPIKKECFQPIEEFQSPNSLDHLGQFAMVHEANNSIKSEFLQSSDNPKIDNNLEQDCQMAADLAAVSIKNAREKLENEDFVPIKKGAKIWEFFLFNKKDKIAKCTICSNTKSVLKGTQGLNSHIKARHPNIFESFKENLMPLENTKTPSSEYILAQSSKKSFKKTIKKSKCEPSADNKIQVFTQEQLNEHLAIVHEGNNAIKKEPFETENGSGSRFKLDHNSEENHMPLEKTNTPLSKDIQSLKKSFKKDIKKFKCETSVDNDKEEYCKENLVTKYEPNESILGLNNITFKNVNGKKNANGTPRSIVWQFFLLNKEAGKAKCTLCLKIFKTDKTGSTKALRLHLKLKHFKECKEKLGKDPFNQSMNKHSTSLVNYPESDLNCDKSPNFKKHPDTKMEPDENQSDLIFENVREERKSKVWQFFLLNKESEIAKCTLCFDIFKTAGFNTKGLIGHLKSKHFKECMEKVVKDPFNQSMDKESKSLVSSPENDSNCSKSPKSVKSSYKSFVRQSKSLIHFPEYNSNCNKSPTPVKPRNTLFIKDSDINTNPKNVIDNDKLLCLQVFEKYSKKFEEFREHWVDIVDISPIEIIKELAKIVDEFFKIWRKYEQWSPLQIAVMCGNLKLCKYMVWTGKDKNPRQKDGMTALHFAVQNNNLEVCKIIIDHAEEKNPGCAIGNTPLHWAAILGYFDICKYIMEKLDDEHPKNANGKSPIHFAAQYGHLEVYKLLVENIEDKNHGDNDGITPLHMAAKYGHLEVYR